jgi:hypothetical protein
MQSLTRGIVFLSSLLCAAGAGATGIAVQVQDATGKVLPDTVIYVEPEGGAPAPKSPPAPRSSRKA